VSLRARLVLAAAYLLSVAVITLEVPLARYVQKAYTNEFEAGVLTNAVLVAARINDDLPLSGSNPLLPPQPPAVIATIADQTAQATGTRMIVTDALGRLVADSARESPVGTPYATDERPELLTVLSVPGGQIDIRRRFSRTLGQDLLYVTVPVVHQREAIGAVRASVSLAALNSRVRRSWLGFGLIGVIVILVGLGLAWFLATTLARPVRRLEDASARLGTGDLTARAEPGGPKEIAALGGSFNTMAEALAANISAQRDFLANASHQLRTPLTGIKLRLEAIEQEGGFAAAQAKKAEAEVDRLADLVNDLLALAKASSAEAAGSRVDLAEVAARAAERWTGPATEAGMRVVLEAPRPAAAWANQDDLAHVLDNLIENAIRYCPEGTQIRVEAIDGSLGPTLAVTDDGPGIGEEDRTRVFERFFRGASGRKAGSGTGLGLAVVAELVGKWDGAVRLRQGNAGPGSRFEASFPRPPTIP
jgi:signal transduction histidine kinase